MHLYLLLSLSISNSISIQHTEIETNTVESDRGYVPRVRNFTENRLKSTDRMMAMTANKFKRGSNSPLVVVNKFMTPGKGNMPPVAERLQTSLPPYVSREQIYNPLRENTSLQPNVDMV